MAPATFDRVHAQSKSADDKKAAQTTPAKPASTPANQFPQEPASQPVAAPKPASKPTPPAPKPAPEPDAEPTANETPATYLARHQKPMLPSEQTIKEIAKARAKSEASKKAEPMAANDTGKPVEPEGGRYVIIAGEGTMPIGADNWRRVQRGVSISVSADELALLERNGVDFKRA